MQGWKLSRQACFFLKNLWKGAKHPYWSNKKTIIPIFFVSILWFLYGPSDRSRTCGLLNPIQARYQTAPHPDIFSMLIHYTTTRFLKSICNQIILLKYIDTFVWVLYNSIYVDLCTNIIYFGRERNVKNLSTKKDSQKKRTRVQKKNVNSQWNKTSCSQKS